VTAAASGLAIGSGLVLADSEIAWSFGPTGGPGGQHANRAHTRVEARVDLEAVLSLPPSVRTTLIDRLGGEVRVVVDETRSQSRNRDIARARLVERLSAALVPTRRRRKTKPTKAAKRRRLDAKRRRSETKRLRRPPALD